MPRGPLLILLAFALAAAAATGAIGARGQSPPAPPHAVVRVDQVGYPAGATKRAYLMSEKSDPGAAFRVVASSGRVVFRGHAGRSTGGWSARYSHVYPLDFDHVRTTGTYTVVVSGAKSPRFRIEPPRKLYAGALANSLFFYEAERDGPDFIRSALRTAPGHLNDEHAMTYLTPKPNADDGFNGDLKPLGVRIDASGGWWDAGDYPKFVETTSYTVALMLLRVRDYPAELGAGAGRSNFASEAAFGTDFLLRMWNDRTRTLYYQVGIGEGNSKIVGDHDIWRLPQADDTYGGKNPRFRYIRHRPVFRAGPPGSRVSPNLAGRDAAAFALCYQDFRRSRPWRSAASSRGSTSSISPTPRRRGRSSPSSRTTSIPRAPGRTTSSSAPSSSTTRSPPDTGRPGSRTSSRSTTSASRRTGRAGTSTAATTGPTRSTSTTSRGSRTRSSIARSAGPDTCPGCRRPAPPSSAISSTSSPVRSGRRAGIRSGSASPGRNGTRLPTAPASPSRRASRPAHRHAPLCRLEQPLARQHLRRERPGESRSASVTGRRSRSACSTRSRTSSARPTGGRRSCAEPSSRARTHTRPPGSSAGCGAAPWAAATGTGRSTARPSSKTTCSRTRRSSPRSTSARRSPWHSRARRKAASSLRR
jgi:hypothetical protein